MAKIFYTGLNLNLNELQNAVIGSVHEGSGANGQIYYDTTENKLMLYTGSGYVPIAVSGGIETTLSPSSDNNIPTTNAVKIYVDTAIQGLDTDVTSDDATVATVRVVEADGVITDVIVTNVSAGVAYTASSGQTGPNITASTSTGAVTGADIATIKSYVDALAGGGISALDVDGYAQAGVSSGGIKIFGIQEIDGKISHDSTTDFTIAIDGTYDASDNKVASVSTIMGAIAALDVTAFGQASMINASNNTEGGTFTVNGISETNGKIATDATTNKTTLTVGRGLSIYNDTIGHAVTRFPNPPAHGYGIGESGNGTTTIVTGLEWDAYGHIVDLAETTLNAYNIACNPVVSGGNDDIQGALGDLQGEITAIANGMIYKGAWSGHTQGITVDKVGDTYTYDGNTSTTIDGQTVEPGDTIIISAVDGSNRMSHIVVLERNVTGAVTAADTLTSDKLVLGNGSQAVKASTYGITLTPVTASGSGANTDILTSDAVVTTIANKLSNLDGTATIASNSNNVITIKTGVIQTNGEIGNDGGTDIVLEEVAVTGAAADVSIADAGGLITATNVEDALQELASAISSASITIDGQVGQITTGNGITKVTINSKVIALDLDTTNTNGLYLSGSTEGEKQLAMHIADESTTANANFGTVKITNGNGLTISSGVVSYAHNTDAITVAEKNTTTNVVTINGTLTPDASDTITASNSIALAPVAATGAANELTVTSAVYGTGSETTNAQTALTNLASSVSSGVKMWDVSSPANGSNWVIDVTTTDSGWNAKTNATVSVRNSSGEEVECDKVLSGTLITLTISGTYSAGDYVAVVTTRGDVAAVANTSN